MVPVYCVERGGNHGTQESTTAERHRHLSARRSRPATAYETAREGPRRAPLTGEPARHRVRAADGPRPRPRRAHLGGDRRARRGAPGHPARSAPRRRRRAGRRARGASRDATALIPSPAMGEVLITIGIGTFYVTSFVLTAFATELWCVLRDKLRRK